MTDQITTVSFPKTGIDVIDRNMPGFVAAINAALRATQVSFNTTNTNAKGAVTAVTGTAPITSTGGTTPAIGLADTAVAPGPYGDATHIATFIVDQEGRLTAAANVAITPPSSTVPGIGALFGMGVSGNVRALTQYMATILAPNASVLTGTIAGANGAWNIGIEPSTLNSSGTVTGAFTSDTARPMVSFVTGGTTNNFCYNTIGVPTNTGVPCILGWGQALQGVIEGITATNVRVWTGIVGDSGASTGQNLTQNNFLTSAAYAAFRFNPSLSPNWFACVSDGGGANHQEVDTGVPFVTTALAWSIDATAVPTGGGIDFVIGTGVKTTVTGSGVPANTAGFFWYGGIATLANSAASVAHGSWQALRTL